MSRSAPEGAAASADDAAAGEGAGDAADVRPTLQERGSLGRDVRTVSGLTLVSRFTGLARDAALARVLGVGPVADAFLFAFMVPNLFRRLFGEGALAAAFLPVYARLHGSDPEAGRRLGRRVIGGMVLTLSLVVLVAEVALLVARQSGHGGLAASLAMVLLPYAPMVCAVAILGAMLQVRGRFGPTAAAPLLLNGAMIAALMLPARHLADDPSRRAGLLAIAVVLAGAVQVAWSVLALRAAAARDADREEAVGVGVGVGTMTVAAVAEPSPIPPDSPDLAARRGARDVARHAIPMMIGLGALQLGTLFDGLIASWPTVVGPTVLGVEHPLSTGAMTTISLAQRLYQFPLGVFGIAVATAIFPLLARRASAGDTRGVLDAVRQGLRVVAFIGLPASVGLALVREPLVATLFEGGDFTATDTARAAPVVAAYGLGVWAYSAVHVLARAFYALESPRTAVRIALVALAVGLVLNLTLIWTPLREAGLAVATAVGSALQVVLLLAALGPRLGGPVLDRSTARSVGRSAALALVMGGVVLAVDAFAGRELERAIGGWWGDLARLGLLVAAGGLAFGVPAAMLRLPEFRLLIGRRGDSAGSGPTPGAGRD